MTGSNNISSSFKTAFNAVRRANVARGTVRKKPGNIEKSSSLPHSAFVNFHAVGPAWTGKPAITLRLHNVASAPDLYCFNLMPSVDRHRKVSRSKASGFFLTSTNSDSIIRSNMILLSRKMLERSKGDRLPLSGPPGFTDCMEKTTKRLQIPHFSRQFLERFLITDGDEPYKTNCIEISKIIAAPTNEYCHGTDPTVSYICNICFNQNKEDDTLHHHEESDDTESENHISHNAIAILDCPTVQHFDLIKDHHIWSDFHQNSVSKLISAVIHLTPDDIFNNGDYQNWIEYFGGDCKHLIVNDTSPYTRAVKEYRQVSKLHQLSPLLFPHTDIDANDIIKFDGAEKNIYQVDGRMELSLKGDMCQIIKDESRVHDEDIESMQSWFSDISYQYPSALDELSSNMNGLKSPNCDGYFPSLSVLGSGSVHDNMLRAQPAFLLRLDNENSILLDCGEQTLDRIHLMFGDSANKVLGSIKLILLSHRHLDHHAGFHGLLNGIIQSGGGREQKVFCLMPYNVQPIYSDMMADNCDFINFCSLSNQPNEALLKYKAAEILQSLPIKNIVPVRVDHNVLTFGIVIVTNCGKKIAYSSDTLPMSHQLIKYGRFADLLIHDCLYVESGMEMEAKFRKHGYLDGAIATSNEMNAKFLLLTHFAPQYPLVPYENDPEKYGNNICPALDYMSVSLSDLHKLPHLMTALEEIYRDKLKKAWAKSRSLYIRRVSRNAMVEQFSSLFGTN